MLNTLSEVEVSGIAHITGGGFYENVPRMLNGDVNANIDLSAIDKLPVFDIVKNKAGIDDRSAYNTFNMGIGMMMCVKAEDADKACQLSGGKIIGEITKGSKEVILR